MARKRITGNRQQPTRADKLRKLEKMYEGWKDDFTLDFCWNGFISAQIERDNSPQTIYNYRYFYKRFCKFIDETFTGFNPEEISVEFIATEPIKTVFEDYLKKQGLKQSSINNFLVCMRAFGNWCVDEGYLEFFQCPIKAVPTEIKDTYTEKELEKLLVKPPITNFVAFRCYCMISLMLNTGARRRTLVNIKIKDVDFQEGYINFNVTKTRKVVRLGLDRKTMKDLTEWINYYRTSRGAEEDDYLFCNEYGEQLSCRSVTGSIARYNQERGVEKTSVHLFRHTFAKNWIVSGGDIITLARVLTHSELEMVQRYANLYGGDIKKEILEHSTISQLRTRSGKSLRAKNK